MSRDIAFIIYTIRKMFSSMSRDIAFIIYTIRKMFSSMSRDIAFIIYTIRNNVQFNVMGYCFYHL